MDIIGVRLLIDRQKEIIMDKKYLSISDLFDTQDKIIPIQSVVDKLQTLIANGYTTASFQQDLVMYNPETEAAEFEQHIVFYKN